MIPDSLRFRTRAIHVGNAPDPATGAVVRPVHLAATYVQPGAGAWGEYDYARSGNPTRKALETTLASLESGCGSLAFSSGMAAIHAVTMLLKPGDHIVAGTDIYGGTYRLLHKIVRQNQIDVSLVDSANLPACRQAMRPQTRLLWIETPGNPLMSITDIAACAELADQHGVLLGVDNTFATPALTRPLELGAHITMHSATKYLGGHSDVLGGALVVRDPQLYDQLYFIQNATGAVLGPLESFLCSRGLKTLELRVRAQSHTAARLADYLQGHPQVRQVFYPGLPDHPGHAVAERQMDAAFGAMVSFEIQGDLEAARRIVERTKLFQLAVSLGAVESLIEQPAAMSHASYDAADRLAHGISDSLIRISVGLEAFEDLRDDLEQAIPA
ncbi:MAG: aminotransferase class I/II-fold pyridoxal phosphate-dependent enzyme [Planctomycetales bacterium]|nr:aminotransferase class I/II-fold pyridoxal phosphate-dependent enzyme [Planctomycetales bacterium]NIM07660.1 aminotransferase class I/II-fold pyridoxal phosphate-dependent enzyme [Planctomycetales bacterium]NIN07165.1 aminotransferase class I/II-fold pyridoxal phosphate-dependent enzyme [Planctomycetales bacterium]NIN76258.1 aminotransferase class I/II-fold pyridoxal phosphate-dependent enzyme [Planctomycetales bacterium]NIO33474.1 aminotransferase class I/II-fold pyridoxal phosphate-depende